ncbi:UNVERIFIED_CONTAM: Transcription initiation factor TFIID subunit [Sesamum radiatum]|uniref:Transcription initiation factor TFIID subunit n=1 Tax=Sesamum radiatum TaxID=300843 RepID=A0AAW2RW82_SESRA
MTRWADGTGGDASASASASASADEDMTVDDDDEYEEAEGGNRLLGFMFGNVDNSGDLDVDYLDERGSNGHFLWVMKRNFRIPSEEELRRMVTPENGIDMIPYQSH